MDVIDPGHFYSLNILDRDPMSKKEQLLSFVKREGDGYPRNSSHHEGTTTQEVLRALIDRTKYVDAQIPDWRNRLVLLNLRHAMFNLESRAAERHGRDLPSFPLEYIENMPVCDLCNHIGCEEECRT